MLSSFLVEVASDRFFWTCNVGSDVILVVVFMIYCPNIHLKTPITEQGYEQGWCRCFFPGKSFIVFPGYKGMIMGILLAGNMFLARLPALYYNYENMDPEAAWTSYDNATLLISLSVIPIALYAQFWSVSYMLYNKEFTACPGK